MLQNHLSRLFFLSKGCKQAPLEHTRGLVRWGHPDGYFLKPNGQKATDNYTKTELKKEFGGSGRLYPILRECSMRCHILMALAFYGERPTYTDKNGKPYVGICHHLIPDKLDYSPANLLCWLTREEHTEADRRQSALRQVLPDMHALSYDDHRRLQDPRVTSRITFEIDLKKISQQYGTNNVL